MCDYDTVLYCHKKMKTDETTSLDALSWIYDTLSAVDDFSYDNLHAILNQLVVQKEVKTGYILWPLRVALSGKQFTPGGGVELANVLGKQLTLERLKIGIEKLKK